ncbi:hypothetical protein EV2_004918 [Malus domestica]
MGIQWEEINKSPYKKGRGPESGEVSHRNLAGIWREMNINANCFMIERTIFAANENLSEARATRQRGEIQREVMEVGRDDNENRGGGG